MRLHALELAAIGPFATAQHIDFEQLQASGLFLLDGPTGAGKSTVLDAITFALFGPGDNRGDGRLHSHFADVRAEPYVRLEFSLRGVRYRLRRAPEFQRPKRRGEGMTTVAASAHLERWSAGGWQSRSSNKAEIAEILDDELGLTREQFRQVVLLPQGEFATFLRAKDDERRGVLSRLFGTGLYQRVTDELDARRAEAARAIAVAQQRVATCVAVAAEAAGLSPAERDEVCALDRPQREGRFDELAVELGERCATTLAGVRHWSAAAAQRETEADAVAAELSVLQRFATAQAAHADHLAKAGRVDQARAALQRAVRAEPVRALLAVVDEAAERAAQARAIAGPGVSSADLDVALEQARQLCTDGEVAAERRAGVAARLAAATEVERLKPLVDSAVRAATTAVDAHQQATEEHLRLLELRLAGIAGELAGKLRAGQPCTVCGSPDHPAPAAASADPVDLARVQAAQHRRDEAAHERAVAERTLDRLEHEVTAAATIAEDAVPAELAEQLAALDATVAAAGRAPELAARLRRAVEAVAVAENADEAFERVHRQAADEARAAGFADLPAARAAVLEPRAREDLQRRVESWDATAAALQAALHADEFGALVSKAVVEVETQLRATSELAATSAAAARRAQDERAAAATAAAAAEAARKRFTARRAELAVADETLAQLEADSQTVIHLARLARGMAGQRRVALTTYVLRHWFEHVVDAANIRLASISSGRYALVRVDEGESKSERAGLTLHVIDAHTGEARTPRSLSGGETFYTSLALALGLADVVKAEAGGVDLDTLFIDEGFGSLDSDTLEQVMAVIDDLRDRGRVVGIVSHVADLKERIPERLEVRRLPDGSSALRVVA